MKTLTVVRDGGGSKSLSIARSNLAKFCNVNLENKSQAASHDDDSSGSNDYGFSYHGGPAVAAQALRIFSGDRDRQPEQFSKNPAKNLLDESKFLQWTSFMESELRSYAINSKEFIRGLQVVELSLKQSSFLSGTVMKAEDIYMASYLYSLSFPREKYPLVNSWMTLCLEGYDLPEIEVPVTPAKSKKGVGKVRERTKEEKDGSTKGEKGNGEALPKLKILCLHGYRQSGLTFKAKLGSFRKIAGKSADFTFITAPNQITDDEFGWWFGKTDRTYEAHAETDCEDGFKESVELISQTCKTEGPFHGIMAFSQGAALAATLSALQASQKLDFGFQFYIMVAGFISRSKGHKKYFNELALNTKLINIPSLHVYGSTDKVIEFEMSEELIGFYEQPNIIRHEGGHFVPTSAQTKPQWTDFLRKMQKLCC